MFSINKLTKLREAKVWSQQKLREFVRQIASKENDVNEIWVIARRKERLEELANKINVPIVVFPLDLTRRENIDAFIAYLKTRKPWVDILVNAAGFGKIGSYNDIKPLGQR